MVMSYRLSDRNSIATDIVTKADCMESEDECIQQIIVGL